jgi:hypothetical protein
VHKRPIGTWIVKLDRFIACRSEKQPTWHIWRSRELSSGSVIQRLGPKVLAHPKPKRERGFLGGWRCGLAMHFEGLCDFNALIISKLEIDITSFSSFLCITWQSICPCEMCLSNIWNEREFLSSFSLSIVWMTVLISYSSVVISEGSQQASFSYHKCQMGHCKQPQQWLDQYCKR